MQRLEMVLTGQEILRLANGYIGVTDGYLGDFNYQTHAAFYPEFCSIFDIFPEEFEGTTRQRFITILAGQTPDRQAKILRGVLERFPANSEARQNFKPTIDRWIRELEGAPAVESPKPVASMSSVVRQALIDAENLIRTSGPASAVDRVHTALHGHLNSLCIEANISLPKRSTLQMAMKLLRENHPALAPPGERADEVSRVLHSMASTLDALNTLRNNASPAHPNRALLGDQEAILAINAARTIFAYIDSKVCK